MFEKYPMVLRIPCAGFFLDEILSTTPGRREVTGHKRAAFPSVWVRRWPGPPHRTEAPSTHNAAKTQKMDSTATAPHAEEHIVCLS